MRIAREHQEIQLDLSRGSCVTIGNFDGVHCGHQKLISRVVHSAEQKGMTSVAVCFCPHPLRVLVGPHTPPFISTREQKIACIEALGVDLLMLLNFTKDMAAMEPEDFVRTYLLEWLNMRELVVGYDYSFGRGRKGDFQLLSALGEQYGYAAERLDPVIIDGAIVSSTRIRDLIKNGEVWKTRPLLGRFYTVTGTVVRGHGRGRGLGFPTANLKLDNELTPQVGVYALWVRLENGETFPAVCSIGSNPTFGDTEVSVEPHILDFDGRDLYGQEIELLFVQRIRGEKKFSGVEELCARIAEDIALARRILEAPEAQV